MAASYSICEACLRGNTHSEGFSWCSDCEEILCNGCDNAHRILKLTLSHHLVPLAEIPEVPNFIPEIQQCDAHPDHILCAYCTFHDEVCCKACLIDKHRSCDEIKTLDEASKDIQSSVLFEDIVRTIPDLLKTIQSVKESRQQNKEAISVQELDIKDSISKFKMEILRHLDVVEGSLIADLARMKEESLSRLDNELEEIENMNQSVLNHQNNLNFTISHCSRSKLFLLMEKLKHDVSSHENEILKMVADAKDLKINLKFNTSDIESLLYSSASLDITEEQCDVKHKSILQKKAQYVPSTINLDLKSFISMPKRSAITGIEITKENDILICDWQNDKLLIYTEDGSFIAEPPLDGGDPYGIALVPNQDEVVITMPHSKCIQYFDTKNRKMTKRFNTKGLHYGIQVLNTSLVVGEMGKIMVLSMNGDYMYTIPYKPIANMVRFIHRRSNDSIIFTDSKNVHCITLDGKKIFEYSNTETARGVDVDRYGHVYITDKDRKSVLQISPDGKDASVVLNESDSIGEPLAIRFSRDYCRLYVGSNQSKLLALFNCKWI